jgi:hypothetical protein
MLSFVKLNFSKIRLAAEETAKKGLVISDKCALFLNQLLDSAIVGGISGISTLLTGSLLLDGINLMVAKGSLAAAGVSFALAFLIKLKEYRRIE